MNRDVNDFTTGNIRKQILAFYMPLLMTTMLQQVYNYVDTLIVGKGLGDNALAAVGNMGSLFFLIVGFSLGLANGFGVLIAQSYGAKNLTELRKRLAAVIRLTMVLTVVLTAFSVLMLPTALRLLRTDEVIMADCLKYGYFVFGGIFSAVLYNIAASVLRSLGDSKTPLRAIVVSSVVNIVLDCLFIFVLHTGVEGAAIATVLSQVVSAGFCLRKLAGMEMIRLTKSDFEHDFRLDGLLLKNGLPMAFMNSITAIGCMAVQAVVNGFGVDYTSAYAVCSKYINLFMNPACTSGLAMSAFTGQNYGAERYDRIREGLKVCLMISFVSYLIFGSIMVFGYRQLADFMLKGERPIGLAGQYFPVAGMMLICVDLLFVFRSAVQGMGYPMIPMLSGVAEMVLRIGIILLLMNRLGFVATALAEASAWVGALLINMAAYGKYMGFGFRFLPHPRNWERRRKIRREC